MKYLPLKKVSKIFQNTRKKVDAFCQQEIDYTVCAISGQGDSVTKQLVYGEQFRVDDLPFTPYKMMVVASIRDVHYPGEKGMFVVPSTTVTVYEG